MKGLHNKGVVITGGASGIGEATVMRFLKEGSRVAVIDRDEEAVRRISDTHPEVGAFVADVGDPGQVDRVFRQIDDHLPRLDILINNAGISIRHSFLDITAEEWREVIRVNLNGVFYVAREAARRMAAQEGGTILNMGSTNGLVGTPFYADYNASKAGVIELTKSMALEDPLAPPCRSRGSSGVVRLPGIG